MPIMLQRMSLLVALSCRAGQRVPRQLSGVKRTRSRSASAAANDPTATFTVPKDDKFQVITEHASEELNFPASYLGNHYSQDVVFIQITLNAGRSIELKKAFHKRIVDDIIAQLKTRPDDVVINLVEVPKENWSYGFGIAQYVA